jgi:transketolase C-terminal domain/subunit
MNGMALHGGVIPYGGTFLVFTDYARPAIRLSALQRARVIYVMTHDSIGLGEDGPTHQPIEHLQSLRAMPGLEVYRPADAVETAECWALALASGGPSVLALTRQNVQPVRTAAAEENLCALGAYRLKSARNPRKVILIATGSEVEIALGAAETLEAQGIGTDVVSMPCTERFDAQPASYREDILPDVSNREILRVSIEAGTTFGWERYVGLHGLKIGIDRFGVSAPAPDAYDYFGLAPDKVAARAVGEEAGAFERDLDAIGPVRQLRRIALGGHVDALAVDDDVVALGRDLAGELAVDAVMLEQPRIGLGIGEVVDADQLEPAVRPLENRARDQTADAAEAIDCNFGHEIPLCFMCSRTRAAILSPVSPK